MYDGSTRGPLLEQQAAYLPQTLQAGSGRCHLKSLEVTNLTLRVGGRTLLERASLAVESGEMVAVMGPSGSGKTSLLHGLAGIVTPVTGTIEINAIDIARLPASARAAFRLRHIGMIFQFGELLPELTVLGNVSLLPRLQKVRRAEADTKSRELLAVLGLGDRTSAFPDQLSGGERQRVGIARALSTGPRLVLADEPTGALDEANALNLIDLLTDRARAANVGVIVATHDPLVAARADRVLYLRDQSLVEASRPELRPLGGRRPA